MSSKSTSIFTPQRVIGTTFGMMGLATLLFPETVTRLGFTNKIIPGGVITPMTLFAMRMFGSQATLQGVLILSCKFEKETYVWWGAAILPFFVFDAMAYAAGYLTPFGAIGDGLGNVVFVVGCYVGYKSLVNKRAD